MPVPSRHETVVFGARTTYWQYGDSGGEPLVFIHGFRGDHHGLEGIAREIPAFRVIVPDLPGFGQSEALQQEHTLPAFGEWLRAFIDSVVGGAPFALVGHSFGSLVVAQAVALGVTPRTLSLINPISAPALEGPRAILTQLAVAYYRVGAALPERWADLLLKHPAIVRVMSEAMAKTRDRKLRAWIHAQHHEFFSTYTDRKSLLEAFTASVSHTVVDFSESFSMPTQVIAGELDDITPLTEQLRFARQVPGAEFHVIRGSGHLVHYEATVQVAQLLSKFSTQGQTP